MATINKLADRGITLDEAVDCILAWGMTESDGKGQTIIFEGHMGTGKSTMLPMVHERLVDDKGIKTHKAFYFDCTTKMDSGDVMIPKLKELDGADFVRFATNEELGIHLTDQPIVLMLDEFGKGNKSLTNSLMRLTLERKMGAYELHPDSIIFATTNLSSENVGDMLPPQNCNRVTVMRLRKPEPVSFIEWGYHNSVDPIVLSWVNDNPQVMQSFEETESPTENEMIYHPQGVTTHFCTPRSMTAASRLLKKRHLVTTRALKEGLNGTIGEVATVSLMSHMRFVDQLPTLDEIKNDPFNAKLPDNTSAMCLLVFRTLATIERNWVNKWMDYMSRMNREAQALFALNVIRPSYKNRSAVMTNSKFMDWARANGHLTQADV